MTGYDDLVATALLGTQRRPSDPTGWPEPLAGAAHALDGDPAAVLLQRAALATVWLRAGALPGPVPDVAPARDETLPPVPAAAAARLATVLAVNDDALLGEWLSACVAAGYVAPPAALPDLLDRAARSVALRDGVRAVCGHRGGWLAGRREEWRWWGPRASAPDGRSATGPGGPAGGSDAARDGDDGDDGDEVWRFGTAEQRRRRLAAVRRAEPARARELLAATWKQEAGAGRAALLGELRQGLQADDEAFLEQALDDRRKDVRETAARLLAGLPGSGLSQRMARRALAVVQPERGLLRSRLVVRPPESLDRDDVRDGLTDPPPQAPGHDLVTGRRASWVQQVVAAAPLAVWAPLGGPRDVVRLAVADGWAPVLQAGWAAAAAREGDVAWVEALLSVGADVAGGLGAARLGALLAGLPPQERARLAVLVVADLEARVRRRDVPADAAAVAAAALAACERPWPGALVDAALAWLGTTAARMPAWPYHGALDLLGHALPPASAGRVAALAGHARDDEEGRRWASRLRAAATLLTTRAEMLEELR